MVQFQRAIEHGDLMGAEMLVRELGVVYLSEALELTALIALKERGRLDRLGARWLQRWLEEERQRRPSRTLRSWSPCWGRWAARNMTRRSRLSGTWCDEAFTHNIALRREFQHPTFWGDRSKPTKVSTGRCQATGGRTSQRAPAVRATPGQRTPRVQPGRLPQALADRSATRLK
jgi:hypothetical protein